MKREDLITKIADDSGITKKQASKVLSTFFDGIYEALGKEEKVSLTGFGSFQISHRKERMGMNPLTKEKVPIPATKVPTFRAGKKLKEAVK